MPPETTLLYFAYGSNLCSARLAARVPSASALGAGQVTGRQLLFHKLGRDGSGKADAARTAAPGACVLGVVYRIDARERAALDRAEGGYHAVEVEVILAQGGTVQAFLYEALPQKIDRSLRPYDWYKSYLVRGAREHGLPASYAAALEQLPATADPDPLRRRKHQR